MKAQLTLLILLAMNVTLHAQTNRKSRIVKSSQQKPTEETAERVAARARAKLDSIQKVQVLAKEMARQMFVEDSIQKAKLSVAESPKTMVEQTMAVNPQRPETTYRQDVGAVAQQRSKSDVIAPKGIISIGPSVQFNSELQTALIGGSIGLGYSVGRKIGVLLAADYHVGNHTATYRTYPADLIESYNTSAITLRPEFRFYPTRSFEGFFIGLNGTLMSYKVGGFKSGKLLINNETAGGGGLVMGVNLTTPSRLNFEFSLSGGVVSGANDDLLLGSGALRIGYAF